MLLWHLAMTHLYYPCYSSSQNWSEQGQTLTQYFCFVLDVQGKSEQKLLVEDKLSNLTLASADDKICYLTFKLLILRLFMTAHLSLKFWTFRFLDFVITA